jgi:hypothetical protein
MSTAITGTLYTHCGQLAFRPGILRSQEELEAIVALHGQPVVLVSSEEWAAINNRNEATLQRTLRAFDNDFAASQAAVTELCDALKTARTFFPDEDLSADDCANEIKALLAKHAPAGGAKMP